VRAVAPLPDRPQESMVPADQVSQWLGISASWLQRLGATGEIPTEQQNGTMLVDPRDVEDFTRRSFSSEVSTARAELRLLREISAALAAPHSLESLCRELLGQLERVVESSESAVFLSNGNGAARLVAARGSEDPESGLLSSIADWAIQSGEVVLTNPFRAGIVAGAPDSDAQPRDCFAVPLRANDEVVGAAVLLRGMQTPQFTGRELSMASVLATEAALAIERAQIHSTLENRIGELDLVQRQMEAYARDVRQTFAAEREKADALSNALSELEQTYLATVRGLAVAVEAKDAYTAGHIVRVTKYGLMMMDVVAPHLSEDRQFEYGFLLHDIGKLAVPDAVLGKPGKLTDEEWKSMRLHPETGRHILEEIPFLTEAREIVFAHHERWDGNGYPMKLRGEEIPLGARVFPISDSFDAMTSNRPYRGAMQVEDAVEEIRNGSGTQYWPAAVEAFMSIPSEALETVVQTGIEHWDPRGAATVRT
jgi:cyclic di-GMP phosphodiesterase